MTFLRTVTAAVLLAAFLLAGAPDASGQSRFNSPAERKESGGQRNLRTAALSLLIPGLGQMRLGETTRGLAFMVAEAGLWTAFGVFQVQGSLREDSYVEMAELFAGVPQAEGRSDDYYRLIGNWSSSEAYNEVIMREARAFYGDDLEGREAYFQANRVQADQEWDWESGAAQERYRDKRSDSRSAYKNARNMLGLAAANRVVSMIDAALLARRQGLSLTMMPGEEPLSAQVRLSYSLP